MKLLIPERILRYIHAHSERAYPEEGAGLLLGRYDECCREVEAILPLDNAREQPARHNRYLITAQDMLRGEEEAERLGLDVLGIFHSHPDHPDRPSEYDRQWALPWFSYLITSVQAGKAVSSLSWRLRDDRVEFIPEEVEILNLQKS